MFLIVFLIMALVFAINMGVAALTLWATQIIFGAPAEITLANSAALAILYTVVAGLFRR